MRLLGRLNCLFGKHDFWEKDLENTIEDRPFEVEQYGRRYYSDSRPVIRKMVKCKITWAKCARCGKKVQINEESLE